MPRATDNKGKPVAGRDAGIAADRAKVGLAILNS